MAVQVERRARASASAAAPDDGEVLRPAPGEDGARGDALEGRLAHPGRHGAERDDGSRPASIAATRSGVGATTGRPSVQPSSNIASGRRRRPHRRRAGRRRRSTWRRSPACARAARSRGRRRGAPRARRRPIPRPCPSPRRRRSIANGGRHGLEPVGVRRLVRRRLGQHPARETGRRARRAAAAGVASHTTVRSGAVEGREPPQRELAGRAVVRHEHDDGRARPLSRSARAHRAAGQCLGARSPGRACQPRAAYPQTIGRGLAGEGEGQARP